MITSYAAEPGFWVLAGLVIAGLTHLAGTVASRRYYSDILSQSQIILAGNDEADKAALKKAIDYEIDLFQTIVMAPFRALSAAISAPVRLWKVRGKGLNEHLEAMFDSGRKPLGSDALDEIDTLSARAFILSRPLLLVWGALLVIPLLLVSAPFLFSASGVLSKTVDAVASFITRDLVSPQANRPHHA